MQISAFTAYRQLSPASLVIFGGYLLSLFFFAGVDVYHHHFFSSGVVVFVYNFFRLFYLLCLMWLCYAVGDYAVWRLQDISLENTLLKFFVGLSIWQIVLLPMGFAGLYQYSIMMGMTTLLFIVSLPRLSHCLDELAKQRFTVYRPGVMLLFLPVLYFLVTKGLYPSGGHDYFTHYFSYYRDVVESGSLMQGRAWYHFYYDKGLGLYFLSMLLTDPLAPQLVTVAMIFASAGIIFSLVRQSTDWRLLPWVAVCFYIFFLIYTPGPDYAMRETGWNELEKSHEPATILLFFIMWVTIQLAQATTQLKSWGAALLLSTTALAIMSLATAVFAVCYLILVLGAYLLYRKKAAAIYALMSLVFIGITVSLSLWVNYWLTGLPDEQQVLLFWKVINFDKVNQWGGLFQIMNLREGRMTQARLSLPIDFDLLLKIQSYLRMDIWGPLLVFVLLGWLSTPTRSMSKEKLLQSRETKIALFACGGFLLMVLGLSFVIGRDQPVSFYRFTSFTYAPALCFCMLLVGAYLSQRRGWACLTLILGFICAYTVLGNRRIMLFQHPFILMGCLLVAVLLGRDLFQSKLRAIFSTLLAMVLMFMTLSHFDVQNHHLCRILQNVHKFAIGRYSLADAYRHQGGFPGRMPWGAIYPPMEKIWLQLPPKTRIWSWHIHSYCMLPDCEVEGFTSFQMSPHENEVFFGHPQQAKNYLKKEKLNYFFFSNKLVIRDPLILSPLFSPQHIQEYLGIAWTDGENTLLTWKEQARYTIDRAWLNRYVESNRMMKAESIIPYDKFKKIAGIVDLQARYAFLRKGQLQN